MRFHVPQFIEKESKLIGPLTLRQFLWLLAGALVFIMAQFLLTGTAVIVAFLIIALLSLAMAYGKINGVSMPRYTFMAVNFLISGKKFIFTKKDNPPDPPYGKGGTGR